MSEGSGQRDGGQLPKFPSRKHDRERLERAERRDRRQGWLPEAVSLIVDLMTSWR
jgi:hypothetical protein